MALRFRKPKLNASFGSPRQKNSKSHWGPIELPAGLLAGIFNSFRGSSHDSLREIFISSQVATPLCQADVDSALAMMTALVDQEILLQVTTEQACLSEINQLLEELDLSRDEIHKVHEGMKSQSKRAEPQALPSSSGIAPEKQIQTNQESSTGNQPKELESTEAVPSLQYSEAAQKEIASKSQGDC